MQYEEIPIDDSKGPEQFEVGDMVRLYGFDSKARTMYKDLTIKSMMNSGITCEDDTKYIWKQCRLLKEVKPIECWYCYDCKKADWTDTSFVHARPDCRQKLRHMREVIE